MNEYRTEQNFQGIDIKRAKKKSQEQGSFFLTESTKSIEFQRE
jgi:hypothetical protein